MNLRTAHITDVIPVLRRPLAGSSGLTRHFWTIIKAVLRIAGPRTIPTRWCTVVTDGGLVPADVFGSTYGSVQRQPSPVRVEPPPPPVMQVVQPQNCLLQLQIATLQRETEQLKLQLFCRFFQIAHSAHVGPLRRSSAGRLQVLQSSFVVQLLR